MSKAKPPGHLSAESKRIWREIVRDYEIDRAAELLLVAALEAKDRRDQARLEIEKDGAVLVDRFGQRKVSPWVAIERDSGMALCRAWRLLGFDQEPRGEFGMGQRR